MNRLSAPKYLIDCPTCGAPALERCVTLTTGRTTDTHSLRVHRQHETKDRATVIRRVINGIYGSFAAAYMPAYIDSHWDEWQQDDNRDELMLYIWMNCPGGGTAEIAAQRIRDNVQWFEQGRFQGCCCRGMMQVPPTEGVTMITVKCYVCGRMHTPEPDPIDGSVEACYDCMHPDMPREVSPYDTPGAWMDSTFPNEY